MAPASDHQRSPTALGGEDTRVSDALTIARSTNRRPMRELFQGFAQTGARVRIEI